MPYRSFPYTAGTRAPEGQDVRSQNDHAMDDIRYFAATVASRPRGTFLPGGWSASEYGKI